ncbi:hypothetical protein BDFG_05124 [Blastomyces dermatitidis ATCC 26199]|nr:hypothetical protein BDFG_05124 [Blastomyces dermatitidis ATCC 26199]
MTETNVTRSRGWETSITCPSLFSKSHEYFLSQDVHKFAHATRHAMHAAQDAKLTSSSGPRYLDSKISIQALKSHRRTKVEDKRGVDLNPTFSVFELENLSTTCAVVETNLD